MLDEQDLKLARWAAQLSITSLNYAEQESLPAQEASALIIKLNTLMAKIDESLVELRTGQMGDAHQSN